MPADCGSSPCLTGRHLRSEADRAVPGLCVRVRVAVGGVHLDGRLAVDDPAKAARQFNWLVMAEPVNRAMLLGQTEPPSKSQIEEWATNGVGAFLAIYRVGSGGAKVDE